MRKALPAMVISVWSFKGREGGERLDHSTAGSLGELLRIPGLYLWFFREINGYL